MYPYDVCHRCPFPQSSIINLITLHWSGPFNLALSCLLFNLPLQFHFQALPCSLGQRETELGLNLKWAPHGHMAVSLPAEANMKVSVD